MDNGQWTMNCRGRPVCLPIVNHVNLVNLTGLTLLTLLTGRGNTGLLRRNRAAVSTLRPPQTKPTLGECGDL